MVENLCFVRNDEELAARQQLEREIREIRAQLDDAVEEATKEKTARQKAEKARRDMAEELESYKQELEESNDKSALHSQLKAKRDEEYAHLQVFARNIVYIGHDFRFRSSLRRL